MAVLGLMLLLGLGAPLGAFLIRCAVSGRHYAQTRWPVVAIYYGVLVAFIGAEFVGLRAFSPCVLMAAGPIVGFVLLMVGPNAADRSEPRGFDVLPPGNGTPGADDAGREREA